MTKKTPIIIGISDVVNRSLEVGDVGAGAVEPLEMMLRAVRGALVDAGGGGEGGDEGERCRRFGKVGKLGMLSRCVDDVRVVRSWTWVYGDVCGGVLEGVRRFGGGDEFGDGDGDGDGGDTKVYMEESDHGGNSPVRMLDEACRRVARGESRVAVVVGGEALGSCELGFLFLFSFFWFFKGRLFLGMEGVGRDEDEDEDEDEVGEQDLGEIDNLYPFFHVVSSVTKTGTYPQHWRPPAGDPRKILALPEGVETPGTIHSIGLPIHIYPLFENAFRALRHQSQGENHAESAKLYAQFAKIAAGNEYAWNKEQAGGLDEEKIRTVGKRNRMICWPYPLLMNAFNNVNMAACCIVTSVEFAREVGISEDKWIYPLGGAGMRERENFWERPNFYSSEALETSLDSAMSVSGLKTEDIDLFDLYSCFPIVPKLAAHHLKIPFLDPPKPITLLGGLTYFGGAGNNYSLHAVTEMVRQLRKKRTQTQTSRKENEKASHGLILANGGVLTYQHVICLSTQPRSDGKQYQDGNPCPDVVQSSPVLRSMEPPQSQHGRGSSDGLNIVGAEGVGSGVWEAFVETYTVQFSRTNEPEIGYVVGRLKKDGRRFVANVEDEKTLGNLVKDAAGEEVIGKNGWVWMEEGGKRNLFGFEMGARL
ncbi:hypothetical protein DSL72_004478 [Monilinia vaccinii-corymbosi]|uniref:Thiolase-like protein type 1 additional C-terminal domain-containing protein n=1 Tax=Monilinia vaccinii-corymbosi TaxID=61207 RepID=A0A8A3P0L8_9HELO|nr:hypothetical protein DSL72_004478 [Monilinia vaccinii-corymbosi]